MTIQNSRDFWSGVMFCALGLFFVVVAQEHAMGTAARMGPAYFPTLLGGLLTLLGLILTVRGWMKMPADGSDGKIEAFHGRTFFLILGSVLAFSLLLPTCGLMIALAALIVISSLADHGFRWKEIVAVIVVLDALAYVTFVYAVGMIIPVWPVFLR